MEVKFNVTGERRKEMVGVISGIIGITPVYMRMPTCNYVISNFTVTKDGTLMYDDRCESELVKKVLASLAQAGFETESPATAAAETADTAQETETTSNPAEAETAPQGEPVGLTVEISLDAVQVGNLTKILEAKGGLIKKALGVDDLRFEIKDDRIAFPWFAEVEPDEATAYTHFISALCEMARNQKRITAKEKETDNDKYAFRCFLLRLGFIGAEFKAERKILLRNLSGSSAFKSGQKKDDASKPAEPIPEVDWDAENREDATFIADFNAAMAGGENDAVSE